MKNWIIPFVSILFFASCSEQKQEGANELDTPEKMIAYIQEMDDSLKLLVEKQMSIDTFKIDKLAYHEAINRNKAFIEKFPDHEKVEESIEKIASLYMQIGVEKEAVKWRDSLLINYPNNDMKLGLLEFQMNYYDFNEYNPEKIEYYIGELLKLENLSEEKKSDYEFRLKHIDKKFDELIQLRMDELDSMNNAENNIEG